MRHRFKQLGLGRLLYQGYHRPAGAVIESLRAGGPFGQWKTARGRRAMEEEAANLPALPASADPALELHVLTGRRFWYQTAFCLWTFARASGRALAPVVYDDGSLAPEFSAPLARLFPRARFIGREEIVSRLDRHLPAARYPVLRERWLHYPNLRKLTDPHLGSSGWKLVLDSDLLFFRRPKFLLDWLEAPVRPLHAVDVEQSYGYSDRLLGSLARGTLHPRLNVGLCGLDGGGLDWERLEHDCRALIAAEGTNYYLEQALVAILLAGRDCAVAPSGDYVTLPRPPEARSCGAVMHHYVAESKRWYFRSNWRRVLPS